MPDDITKDPRVYFAAERTFLAWIRTGIALMGFGFVVARFGLFLRELESVKLPGHAVVLAPSRLSLWIGVALVVTGVFTNVAASIRQGKLISQLKRGDWNVGGQSRLGLVLACTLVVVGVIMAGYLIAIR